MICEVEELMGEKSRSWKCSFCNIKFTLVADSYIKHCEEIKTKKRETSTWDGPVKITHFYKHGF